MHMPVSDFIVYYKSSLFAHISYMCMHASLY